MVDPKMLARLRKLFALAQSSNPNEAALALNRAQALMEEMGLDDPSLVIEIDEQTAAFILSKAKRLPRYEALLRQMICDAMGVEAVRDYAGAIRFYGSNDRTQVAVYAYTVLARQLARERRKFLAKQSARIKLKTRRGLADSFAEHWVWEATRLLKKMEIPDRERALVKAWEERMYPNMVASKVSAPGKVRGADEAALAGAMAGRRARLDHGVSGTAQGALGETRRIGVPVGGNGL